MTSDDPARAGQGGTGGSATGPRKTGDEPAGGADPGGTRPTQSGAGEKPHVESGDRNTMTKENPATDGD